MKGLRSMGFLKLLAASTFLVSASMAFGTSIKFHSKTGDLDQGTTVIPYTIADYSGEAIPGTLLGYKYIAPTAAPSGIGDQNVLLSPFTAIPPTTAPDIGLTADPSGTGGQNVVLGAITAAAPTTVPDGGSSIEMLSIGLVALFLFRWKMARAAYRAI